MVRRTRNRQLNSAGEQNSTSIDKTTPDHSDDEVHVMAAAQDHLGGVHDSLILQEIRNGNQALSSKLDAKTAEINQSIAGLKVMLDTLNTRTTEAGVLFFPDLSASLMKRRKEFDQVKRELRSKDLPFALLQKGFVFLLNVGALVYLFFFHHGRYTGSCTVHLQGGYDTLVYTVN